MLGLFLPACQIASDTLIFESLTIVVKIAVVVAGSMVAASLILRFFQKGISRIAGWLGVNSYSVVGLIISLATCISMIPMMEKMDDRGKVMNPAFAVSGSFVLGGNSGLQAFTSNNDNFVTNSLTAPCISRGIIKYFPILENVKVVRTWSGWYDQCIDVLPVIDNIKEVPGLTVAFGFSGHGFGISPAVSIAVSELMLDGKSTTIDISQLTYDRFHAKG